jgi:uncharacterized membrane protein
MANQSEHDDNPVNQPANLERFNLEPVDPEEQTINPLLWPKAIPPHRDFLQSRILICIAMPILAYLCISTSQLLITRGGNFAFAFDRADSPLAKAILVSPLFALIAWRLQAATPVAALCGGIICYLVTAFAWQPGAASALHSGLTPLVLLFLLTFGSTRLGGRRKSHAGLAEDRRGRNAAQIIANLGIAALFSSSWGQYITGWIFTVGSSHPTFAYSGHAGHMLYMQILWLPMLAALAEATADTVSSEIGQAVGGQPILLTTLRRVPPGTDGAITLTGTLAGIAAAALVAASAAPALGMSATQCTIAFAAGVAGLFFDSLLGATIERKGWLGNDLVNLTSTAFAAAFSVVAVRLTQNSLLH